MKDWAGLSVVDSVTLIPFTVFESVMQSNVIRALALWLTILGWSVCSGQELVDTVEHQSTIVEINEVLDDVYAFCEMGRFKEAQASLEWIERKCGGSSHRNVDEFEKLGILVLEAIPQWAILAQDYMPARSWLQRRGRLLEQKLMNAQHGSNVDFLAIQLVTINFRTNNDIGNSTFFAEAEKKSGPLAKSLIDIYLRSLVRQERYDLIRRNYDADKACEKAVRRLEMHSGFPLELPNNDVLLIEDFTRQICEIVAVLNRLGEGQRQAKVINVALAALRDLKTPITSFNRQVTGAKSGSLPKIKLSMETDLYERIDLEDKRDRQPRPVKKLE